MTNQPTPLSLTVAAKGSADFRSIGSALAAAPSGAKIRVGPGTYEEKLVIEHDVELVADGPPGSVRITLMSGPLAIAAGAVLLRGLTLWQGQPPASGLARLAGRRGPDEPVPAQRVEPVAAALHIRGGRVRVEGCSFAAANGAGVGVFGSGTTVDLSGSDIRRVTIGVLVLNGATATLDECEFSEWTIDALSVSRPGSRLEVRRSHFHPGQGQGLFVDYGATAIAEDNVFEALGAGIFVDRADTEALIRRNAISRCLKVGIGIADGARAILEGNTVSGCEVGVMVKGPSTAIEATGDRLEDNLTGLGVITAASAVVTGVTIHGGGTGATVDGAGSRLELREASIDGTAGIAAKASERASLTIERCQLSGGEVGVSGQSAGTEVNVRSTTVNAHRGTGVSAVTRARTTVESCDIFDNAFPGIVGMSGATVHAFSNRIHDNRSNGIALRDGTDGNVEGNEVWGNLLPAITVVGAGTHVRVRDNTVRDNTGQGIYVYQGASAEVSDNRVSGNGGAAITVSDLGTSGNVQGNAITGGGGNGVWVADGATARVDGNRIEGTSAPGIFVNDGARAEVHGNRVTGASIGVLIDHAGGNFEANHLLGNNAGSWCLRDPVGLTRQGNEEEVLAVPAWAATALDPALYPLFALRVGSAMGVPARAVATLGSALALPTLASRVAAEDLAAWPEIIKAHLEAERSGSVAAQGVVDAAGEDPAAARERLVAHLELEERVGDSRPSRPTPIPGVLETLSVKGPQEPGVPLANAAGLGPMDELFELGERHIRDGLRVVELPSEALSARAFLITGPYSGSAAMLHLREWCPQVLGTYGALVLPGDAEALIVVPVEDTSIVFALPVIVAVAVGAWQKATWRLRPVVMWSSQDRTDLFEIEIGTGDTVVHVTSPAELPALLARLPEPAERIPRGWDTEARLSHEQAIRLLPIVRQELLSRMQVDFAGLTTLTWRNLIDVAASVRELAPSDWAASVRAFFDAMVSQRAELDRLVGAPYAEVRPHLWVQLDRSSQGGVAAVHREVRPGLDASVILTAGPRKRFVARASVPGWGIAEAQLWADAESNVLAAQIRTSPVGDGIAKYETLDREGEAVGLLLHRRPAACANGYVVGLPHKGAAYALALQDATSIRAIGTFGAGIADIYRKAAAFNDELSAHVFWLEPDGTLVDLGDTREKPPPLPEAFRALAVRLGALT